MDPVSSDSPAALCPLLTTDQPDCAPCGICRIVSCLHTDFLLVCKRHISGRDHPCPRITVHCAIGCNLLHEKSSDTGLLLQLSSCSFFQIFPEIDKSARQRPKSNARMIASLDKKNLQIIDTGNILFSPLIRKHYCIGRT